MKTFFRHQVSGLMASLLLCLPPAVQAAPAHPAAAPADLASSDGYQNTCAHQPGTAASLKNDDSRVAFVICRDTSLVKNLITWAKTGMDRMDKEKPSMNQVVKEIQQKLEYTRKEVKLSGDVLARIRLGQRKSLLLKPAEWQMDLDGDGEIKTWERYFFAIPQRGHHPFRFSMPSDDADYYDKEYNLAARIRVDQSDVLWALAYHRFVEGILSFVSTFDVDWSDNRRDVSITVARPQMMKRAHALINEGLDTSERMRRSVLAERSNEDEWIANPSQTSSVFPIPLDEGDFDTWGSLLKEIKAVWNGEHLLPGNLAAVPAAFMGVKNAKCEKEQGINLSRLFLNPPAAGTRYGVDSRDPTEVVTLICQDVTARHPLSPLPDMASQSMESSAGMSFLRYFYWTN